MEITIAIFSLLIAWFTYRKTFHAKSREEIENFVTHYRATQAMSRKVQQKLKDYANNTPGGWDRQIFNDVTFRQYLSMIERSYESNLSDKLLQDALEGKPSKNLLVSMTKDLETQLSELTKLYIEFDR
ncbi:hypothetical protein LZZ85_27245 [Terrimonas sp. NA20]|uniref:DUF4760 domain-containing protein n=1 Tax=Terrimonas ginsenosidimutans TaxID=2908004 RepID=A0ABS9L078_9BACT|nr:hypothetical protein [Terrimonas ginsenosidimutans]MCG2618029.1 hypothetical protein [Terrimonas ginsenosidimutans]